MKTWCSLHVVSGDNFRERREEARGELAKRADETETECGLRPLRECIRMYHV